jgi:hypothetical protein
MLLRVLSLSIKLPAEQYQGKVLYLRYLVLSNVLCSKSQLVFPLPPTHSLALGPCPFPFLPVQVLIPINPVISSRIRPSHCFSSSITQPP